MLMGCIIVTICLAIMLVVAIIWFGKRPHKNMYGDERINGGDCDQQKLQDAIRDICNLNRGEGDIQDPEALSTKAVNVINTCFSEIHDKEGSMKKVQALTDMLVRYLNVHFHDSIGLWVCRTFTTDMDVIRLLSQDRMDSSLDHILCSKYNSAPDVKYNDINSLIGGLKRSDFPDTVIHYICKLWAIRALCRVDSDIYRLPIIEIGANTGFWDGVYLFMQIGGNGDVDDIMTGIKKTVDLCFSIIRVDPDPDNIIRLNELLIAMISINHSVINVDTINDGIYMEFQWILSKLVPDYNIDADIPYILALQSLVDLITLISNDNVIKSSNIAIFNKVLITLEQPHMKYLVHREMCVPYCKLMSGLWGALSLCLQNLQ